MMPVVNTDKDISENNGENNPGTFTQQRSIRL